jgi:hypothetical protein
MKPSLLILWIMITALSVGNLPFVIADESRKSQEEAAPADTKDAQQRQQTQQQKEEFPRDELVASVIVSYLRGADQCIRGNEELPLAVFAPVSQIGRTLQEQPSLYWYLPNLTPCSVILTVIDGRPGKPLLEATLSPSQSPGVQSVHLADYGLRLSSGVRYQWSISLVPDLDDRSKDYTVSGLIERVEPSAQFRATLAQAEQTDRPTLFAEAGFWYDALAAASDLLEEAPQNPTYRQQRAALLQQVEPLKDVAASEMGKE